MLDDEHSLHSPVEVHVVHLEGVDVLAVPGPALVVVDVEVRGEDAHRLVVGAGGEGLSVGVVGQREHGVDVASVDVEGGGYIKKGGGSESGRKRE